MRGAEILRRKNMDSEAEKTVLGEKRPKKPTGPKGQQDPSGLKDTGPAGLGGGKAGQKD